MICQECHSSFESEGGYHPYLYCELIKIGHPDPEVYLRSYGFTRTVADAMRAGDWSDEMIGAAMDAAGARRG